MKISDELKHDLYIAGIISLALIIVFSLGYFTANAIKIQKPPLQVEHLDYTEEIENAQEVKEGEVVASVNSDKYHHLDCPGAKMIKQENKIFFASATEAQNAGLTLAGNCR